MNGQLRRIATIAGCSALFLALVGFTDGSYPVGNGPGFVSPATYMASGGSGCYWERDDVFGNIIANGFDPTPMHKIVTVLGSDAAFTTQRCGNWSPFAVGTPLKSSLQPTPDGDWQVGADMAVARWVAYPAAGSGCYWERESNFQHTLSSIIQNDFSMGPQVVTLQPGDVGFSSSGCGVWQRLSDDDPRGAFDGFSQGFDTVTANGWAVDPNATSDPINVDIYVDGQLVQRVLADAYRPDVAAALGVSAQHGWQATLNLPQGAHTVCAYAIGVGLGGYNPSLGCRGASYDGNPRGNLDNAVGRTTLQVGGWAFDPSTPNPIAVDVYVDGGLVARLTADQDRPDIGAAFPAFGSAHGYSATLNVADGVHHVCAYAINQGIGSTNPLLGCRNVAVQGNPVGNLDGLSAGVGTVTVSGWSFDPDTPTPIHVHLYLDGAIAADLTADQSRPDIGIIFPSYGSNHGYSTTLPVGSGPHTLCAYGINVGGGTTNPRLGCRVFT